MIHFFKKTLAVTLTLSMVFISFAASSAHAKVIAKCGGSAGYSAYLRNGVLGPQGNFVQDNFGKSRIVFEAEQNASTGETKVDVIFHNSGKAYRASDDGPVYLLNHNPTNNTWMVLAIANTYVDTYLFHLDNKGQGEVVWTNSRSGGTPKAALMRAKCN
tara:strand:- start:104 stop:580 length:477 start_codon:yes stop_codon:yes gene_type:complete